MAIYHLTANVISRGRGHSAVAAAAYRSGARLRDHRYGITQGYANKTDVAHAEIMAPNDAPTWVFDREALWNKVEAAELRKDSQLARVIEVGLPIELTADEHVALLRDYIAKEFVTKGMIADWGVRREGSHNPHAHVLLTMRVVTPSGFGPKERRWNGKATLLEWRAAWAERTNEHLARAGHSIRIDHRTLEAQQIELTPGRRVGAGGLRAIEHLPSHLADRAADQQRIARANGDAILEDPSVVLRALTHQLPSFTHRDLARFLRSRTDPTQFDAALVAVTGSEDLVAIAHEPLDEARFTSRDMVEAAKSLKNRARSMAARRGHGIAVEHRDSALARFALSEADGRVFDYLVGDGDAKAITASVGAAFSPLFAAAHAWAASGWRVAATARSHAVQEQWTAFAGIDCKTLVDREDDWQQGRDLPTRETVLLIDRSEMLDLKRLERIFAAADKARAKLVLVGDAEQVQAMNILSAFHGIWSEFGPTVAQLGPSTMI